MAQLPKFKQWTAQIVTRSFFLKKKKKQIGGWVYIGVAPKDGLGVVEPPLFAKRIVRPLPMDSLRVVEPPPSPKGGGSATCDGRFGDRWTTALAKELVWPPLIAGLGLAKPSRGQGGLGGSQASYPPLSVKGVVCPTRQLPSTPSFLFFFYFSFLICCHDEIDR